MMNLNKYILISVLVFLSACSSDNEFNDPMKKPLVFENPTGMMQKLTKIEDEIGQQNYILLTDAIAILKAYDVINNSLDGFYMKLSGLTPREIIEKAQQHQ
ncbi:hypothetical protein [Marinicella litoralis]|uniref:Uncharacterized protein n=2 Tax=Marinicella litoralis TaxID=644220 RepID=A0A4R6XJ82_9GAMM|nr:hypothetical protein [Marinicella litoralis]TDR19566.1 hypothetical protein C8D91_2123 [Marinicella litoralis]